MVFSVIGLDGALGGSVLDRCYASWLWFVLALLMSSSPRFAQRTVWFSLRFPFLSSCFWFACCCYSYYSTALLASAHTAYEIIVNESSARALAVVNHGKGRCSFWPWNCSGRHSDGRLWPAVWAKTGRVIGWPLGSSVWPVWLSERCSFNFICSCLLVCHSL